MSHENGGTPDVERGLKEYSHYDDAEDQEHEALLPVSQQSAAMSQPSHDEAPQSFSLCWPSKAKFGYLHLYMAFVGGLAACIAFQYLRNAILSITAPDGHLHDHGSGMEIPQVIADPDAGSTTVHPFPPTSPTNAFPKLFPTRVGHAGPTPTGGEPALVATAPVLPVQSGAPFTPPKDIGEAIFRKWGNLSPWYSVPRGAFGVDAGPEAPDGCAITGLHLLHRHGARYPTAFASYGGPSQFSSRLHKTAAKWTTKGELSFMNDWTFKLGEEILTPFGRQQLFDMGVTMRMRYGYLLENFTASNTIPTFRTESQDRMLASAANFALGFFGWPLEGKFQQSVTIEWPGYNNTLAPYYTCPNARVATKGDRGRGMVETWANTYLSKAHKRLAPLMEGYPLSIEDVYVMQQLCPYESVALGYSKFCELFTEEEWDAFDYSLDLIFWYNSAFGSPVGRVQGLGYVQEMISRLTHEPISYHGSSTNGTLDSDPRTFPLHDSLYVDATHEVVVLNVLTALNLSTLAASGPLPTTHIPENRSFRVSELAPFATNVQFQLLSCSSQPDSIRVVVNDGVVPLTGIRGCKEDPQGMCDLDTFIASQQELVNSTSWEWGCHGEWDVGENWQTVTGDPPAKA